MHPASADTVAFVEERNRLVKEREMIVRCGLPTSPLTRTAPHAVPGVCASWKRSITTGVRSLANRRKQSSKVAAS